LITVKGLDVLRRADVVIYDRLAPPELLQEARPDAELIDAGKQPQKQRLDQQSINTLIVQKAREGKLVARLKGGDPFVFGRGGEEALACHAAGIPFVIVPGVTSAVAVPAYAGIPVTQRSVTSAFTVFSVHEAPDSTHVDYESLAHLGGTLVALMGVAHLQQAAEALIAAGMDGATPAACIEWGTTSRQRVIEGTLATLPQRTAEANIQPPAITIIGEVVKLRGAGLGWFNPDLNNGPKPG
jgi:uroporphyrin-III C-methyltransferase